MRVTNVLYIFLNIANNTFN